MILSLMTILLIVLAVINVKAETRHPAGPDLTGKYKLPNGIIIRLFQVENEFYGEIVDVTDFNGGQLKDINNPDKSKREQSLIGKQIIRNLEYDDKTEKWSGGEMYAPERGMWVDLEIETIHDDYLVGKGSKFFFSKKVVWDRIY
ncbi:DUF2147 domain-containing protein [Marinilabilia salmonicolor]|nr:DUF2147 domain-containing protein [Marinilabilia salmonicolor]